MQCPVCKATVDEGRQCRRCRADLTLLRQVEAQAAQARWAAVGLAADGHMDRALALAERAVNLHRTAESVQLLAVLRLLKGDFAGAWQVYRSIQSPASSPAEMGLQRGFSPY
jgi:hypothetical protein